MASEKSFCPWYYYEYLEISSKRTHLQQTAPAVQYYWDTSWKMVVKPLFHPTDLAFIVVTVAPTASFSLT